MGAWPCSESPAGRGSRGAGGDHTNPARMEAAFRPLVRTDADVGLEGQAEGGEEAGSRWRVWGREVGRRERRAFAEGFQQELIGPCPSTLCVLCFVNSVFLHLFMTLSQGRKNLTSQHARGSRFGICCGRPLSRAGGVVCRAAPGREASPCELRAMRWARYQPGAPRLDFSSPGAGPGAYTVRSFSASRS